MLDFFHSFLPNVTQRHIGAAASALGTTLGSLFGWNETVETLLLFMVLDYLTGLLAACISPRLRLSSARGFRGICKKLLILLLVVVAHALERASGIPALHSVVVWFFIGNEGLSILENAVRAGVPVPRKLRAALEGMREEKERG